MKILYIANARIPTEKAHGIQIMKMCEAFASGNELELVLPRRMNLIKDDPFSYYGMRNSFKITKLPCLDLIAYHKYLGHLGLWIESLTFLFFVFFYAIGKKAEMIYGRDNFLLFFGLFKKNVVFEAHIFPKNYFLYSLFFKKTKGIVVITQKLKDLFVEKGISPAKIFVAPDGVDLEKFAIPETWEGCRKKLDLPQDKKIILYTGHLYKWKGVQILLEASRYLPENAEVYFVGGTTEDIQKFSAQSEYGKINIIGHRPYAEIPCWLKAADVLCLPNSGKEEISKSWTSPLKLFEYMAAGKPIVASGIPSIREILNEDNAVLVEPDSPEKLAEGIKTILQNPQLSDKIVARAFKDVQNYTWQKRVEKIHENFFPEKA